MNNKQRAKWRIDTRILEELVQMGRAIRDGEEEGSRGKGVFLKRRENMEIELLKVERGRKAGRRGEERDQKQTTIKILYIHTNPPYPS